jgi:hypothetical protein
MEIHMTFESFYRETFLPEHRHPANVAMHAIGVVGGLALLFWALISGPPWWALAWPVAHAAPGLIGHRLFERSETVGDLRVTRRDAPGWWFILGNHRMVWDLFQGKRW